MRFEWNKALVTAVLLFSLAQADKNETLAKKPEKSETKISASLIVDNKTISSTEKSIETSKNSSEQVISRENARELSVEPDPDAEPISSEDSIDHEELPEALPEALELRNSRVGTRRRPFYRPPMRRPPNSNRRNVFPEPLRGSKRPVRKPADSNKREPTTSDCTFFGKTVCLKTLNYPQEAILRSIRGNRDMVDHLLKDYNIQREDRNDDVEADVFPLETRYERYESNEIRRRSDYPLAIDNNVEEGFTCPSQVMYARPQLARAASGVWKYIINTGDHTQTLRLEKCSKPKSSCSFISDNYRSSCIQVYNYHRLLTWDNDIGLHIDIFKIPSCCSCHVHGYAELYPPLQKDPSLPGEENFPGAEFSTDHSKGFERPSSYLSKLPSTYDSSYGGSKPLDASSSNHPSFILPRPRPKKPSSSSASRPFDKLPQQHAPNTRAPGYKGPMKVSKRPSRPNRPFRRESTDLEESSSNTNTNTNPNLNKWFEQAFDQGTDSHTRPNGEFEDDYEEPGRRVNYNYHPILEFFEPKASMLKATDPTSTQKSSIELTANGGSNSWKPMIAL
ncbi:GSCOCT00004458001.2-RA-CDS [Cotesia congregata]|uniref:Spatzle.1_TollPathway_Cc n=1 Tax=Cotesia congregata TaxID=51543 RepID=A0A8J2HKQ9_COTCN|nr:GSCOCT00004458001.2-RA-CDS [Cotesia congregata]CAG5095336.1 Spatzle.1_TollPathway_Cc [Cotesia congregata]